MRRAYKKPDPSAKDPEAAEILLPDAAEEMGISLLERVHLVNTGMQEETAELPKPAKRPAAATPKDIAERVTMAGLAEHDSDYDITFHIRTLKKDITADFRQSPKYLEQVINAFENYGIPAEGLNIQPVDVTVYTNEGKYILQLSEGYFADITLPIPEDMKNHYSDLKVIRLEDDGSIAILDGKIKKDTISFSTEHFSVFALVAYKDPDTAGTDRLASFRLRGCPPRQGPSTP